MRKPMSRKYTKAFIDHDIVDLSLINALDNLRPILASENKHKSAKYDEDQFVKYCLAHGLCIQRKEAIN
jgi:hypothetical protein